MLLRTVTEARVNIISSTVPQYLSTMADYATNLPLRKQFNIVFCLLKWGYFVQLDELEQFGTVSHTCQRRIQVFPVGGRVNPPERGANIRNFQIFRKTA